MAITVTNIVTPANTSTTTLVGTVPAGGVPAGALIVIGVCERTSTIGGSFSDTAGNTYTSIASRFNNNSSAFGFGNIFYANNVAALSSGDSITYSKQGNGNATFSACYVTGIDQSNPLDIAVTASAGGQSTSPSVTSGAASVTGELFLGFVSTQGSAGAYTQDSAFASPPNQGSSGTGTGNARINGGNMVNALAAAVTFAPSIANSAGWAAFIVAFKSQSPTTGSSMLLLF